ncbi:hypothetical protein E3P77_00691 [Wallemia ichthyophaga]|nr:hypothetical protein E3P77_00691 [Wallemia ichthyophaga]
MLVAGDEDITQQLGAHKENKRSNTLLVMNYVLNALHSSRKVNIRSIYYQNVNAFKKQSNVEEILQRISHVLGIRRESLNVRASHKGLFLSSALSIQLCNGNVLNGSDSVANFIPTMEDIHQVDVSQVAFVLVVEKETVFSTLREIRFTCSSVHGPTILLTGKGYPDFATRDILSHLAKILPASIPFIALVDSDPHGLHIFFTYKFGSDRQSEQHRSSRCSRLMLLGLRCEEFDLLVSYFKLIRKLMFYSLSIPPDQSLRLSDKDNSICSKMEQTLDLRQYSSRDDPCERIRWVEVCIVFAFTKPSLSLDNLRLVRFSNEIKIMKSHNIKWEIEALYNASSSHIADTFYGKCLERYIDNKMSMYFDQQAVLRIGEGYESLLIAPEKTLNGISHLDTMNIGNENEDILLVSDCDEDELLLG